MAAASFRPLPGPAGVRRILAVCALALLWAPLALALHDHGGHSGRADGNAVQCDLCVGHGAAAPAPESASGMALPAAAAPRVPAPCGLPTVAEFDPAHPTRGPPAVHSA